MVRLHIHWMTERLHQKAADVVSEAVSIPANSHCDKQTLRGSGGF